MLPEPLTQPASTSNISIKLTDGFQLVGKLDGSPSFATEFFTKQLHNVIQLTTLNTDHCLEEEKMMELDHLGGLMSNVS